MRKVLRVLEGARADALHVSSNGLPLLHESDADVGTRSTVVCCDDGGRADGPDRVRARFGNAVAGTADGRPQHDLRRRWIGIVLRE